MGDKQAHAAWFGERQRLAVIAISIIGAAGRGNATTEAERTSLTFSSTKAPYKDQCLMGVAFIRGPNRAGATHPDNGFTPFAGEKNYQIVTGSSVPGTVLSASSARASSYLVVSVNAIRLKHVLGEIDANRVALHEEAHS